MDQILDTDYNSNTYFFLTGFNGVLCAGRNSFVINPTNNIVPDAEIYVSTYDPLGNSLPTNKAVPQYAKYPEQTNTGYVYTCFISSDVLPGIGRIEVKSLGISVGEYTGSIAYYQGDAYPVNASTRLPLTQAPAANPFPKVNVTWFKNFIIDVTQPTKSEVRFFDFPSINVRSEIYSSPIYPYASYKLASGSFSAMAIIPKHNYNADYDYQFDAPIYQLYFKSGNNFTFSMKGEKIRIKNPRIKRFTYTTVSNNEITKEDFTLNTDFIATIEKVINETSILLSIPFNTVAGLINLTNEDSPYNLNNLVKLKGYTVNDDPLKQSVFHKKNFYVLSIDTGEYEIFYKDISPELSSMPSGSKYLLNVECNNLRVFCGNLETYKIYGKSLNSPETSTLMCEGKIEADEHIATTNFNNGLYNNPGEFYTSTHVSKYWLINGSCTFDQTNAVLINGVKVSHAGNVDQTDYIIFKDDTTGGDRTAQYINYSIGNNSYWYAASDAFINYSIYPTASYSGISGAPILSNYTDSQENLISGSIHDSNPIKLRQHTLYQLSMRVKAAASNSDGAELFVYFISGVNKTQIGYIGSSYNYGANEQYTNTFFNSVETYGTIIIVPMAGEWDISSVSLKPYQNVDYSSDSFAVKVPYKSFVTNELFEIEMELYDSAGNLAYGKNSYTFKYNKVFSPLKKQTFIDPAGTNEHGGGGSSPDISSDTNYLYIKIFGKWYRTPIATSPQPGP